MLPHNRRSGLHEDLSLKLLRRKDSGTVITMKKMFWTDPLKLKSKNEMMYQEEGSATAVFYIDNNSLLHVRPGTLSRLLGNCNAVTHYQQSKHTPVMSWLYFWVKTKSMFWGLSSLITERLLRVSAELSCFISVPDLVSFGIESIWKLNNG